MKKRIFALVIMFSLLLTAAVNVHADDEGFAVTFAGDAGVASITVYETQDYNGASASVGADGATVTRDSSTGSPDSSGSGQVNFTVVLNGEFHRCFKRRLYGISRDRDGGNL